MTVFALEMLTLKKTPLDIKWLLIEFKDFHKITKIFMISGVGGSRPVSGFAAEMLPLKETFTRFQLAAIPSIFRDFP